VRAKSAGAVKHVREETMHVIFAAAAKPHIAISIPQPRFRVWPKTVSRRKGKPGREDTVCPSIFIIYFIIYIFV